MCATSWLWVPAIRFLAAKSAFSGSTRKALVLPVIRPCPHHSSSDQSRPVTREQTQVYPVLHSTSIKVIGDKSIKLRQRVLYIKGLLVERQRRLFNVKSILGLIDHIRRS